MTAELPNSSGTQASTPGLHQIQQRFHHTMKRKQIKRGMSRKRWGRAMCRFPRKAARVARRCGRILAADGATAMEGPTLCYMRQRDKHLGGRAAGGKEGW